MLETIWFILWGVLWAVYFALDGYDLGMGTLMPFLAKDKRDKRIIFNAAGPFWDGNEVWLLTAGGVTFAAFPKTYAVMFSGLYSALMLLLFAIILRGISFEFRAKVEDEKWRELWDKIHVVSSFLPALLLGVAFANIFKGIPIDAEGINQGGLLDLLNPYGLAGGVLFVLLFCMHGALWLSVKSEGGIHDRAMALAGKLWFVLLVWVVIFLGMTYVSTQLFGNYFKTPALFVILLIPVGGLLFTKASLCRNNALRAFFGSMATIIGTTLFGVIGLYPALLPSSLNPAYSMTIFNSASSPLTLQIMLGVALCIVPVVIAYQTWVHIKFGHKITDADLNEEEAY